MLFDLLCDLIMAGTDEEKETAYRKLEQAGMDRKSADKSVEGLIYRPGYLNTPRNREFFGKGQIK